MATTEKNGETTMPTVLAHPAVATYLAELDQALRGSSAAHADDLREQVREHIEDALSSEATDTEVDETLRRLGSPRELVGETRDTAVPEREAEPTDIRPSSGNWLARRRRSWWVATGLAVIVAVCAVTAWRIESGVPRLTLNCETCGWFTAADAAHNKFTRPDDSQVPSDVQQWTVPLRVRQPQIFTFDVQNPSSHSQRLIGGSTPSGLTTEHISLSFSTADPFTTHGDTHQLTYNTSVSIPPHSIRVVRESWLRDCAVVPGTSETMEFVTLRVKTFGLTRHETLALPAVFETVVGSTPKKLRCR